MQENYFRYHIEFSFLTNFICPIELNIKKYLEAVVEKHLKEYPNSTGFYHKGVFYPTVMIKTPQDKLKSNPLNPAHFNLIEFYAQEHKRLNKFIRMNKQYNGMVLRIDDSEQSIRNKIHDRIAKYIPKLSNIARTQPFIIESKPIKVYFDKIIAEMDHLEPYILI